MCAATWTRLPARADLWTTAYGGLLLVKAAVLLSLGAAGWLHRHRAVARVVGGEHGAFASLAAAEVASWRSPRGWPSR